MLAKCFSNFFLMMFSNNIFNYIHDVTSVIYSKHAKKTVTERLKTSSCTERVGWIKKKILENEILGSVLKQDTHVGPLFK